ncbi:MAG: hypothetical protein ACPGUI_00540 [Halarcobacter sp.]
MPRIQVTGVIASEITEFNEKNELCKKFRVVVKTSITGAQTHLAVIVRNSVAKFNLTYGQTITFDGDFYIDEIKINQNSNGGQAVIVNVSWIKYVDGSTENRAWVYNTHGFISDFEPRYFQGTNSKPDLISQQISIFQQNTNSYTNLTLQVFNGRAVAFKKYKLLSKSNVTRCLFGGYLRTKYDQQNLTVYVSIDDYQVLDYTPKNPSNDQQTSLQKNINNQKSNNTGIADYSDEKSPI